MKDNRQQNPITPSREEVNIPKYIEVKFEGQSITVGENEEGKYLLHVSDTKLTEDYKTMLITEDTFMALITSAIIYFEHYGVNIMTKIRGIIGSDSISYTFPQDVPEKE